MANAASPPSCCPRLGPKVTPHNANLVQKTALAKNRIDVHMHAGISPQGKKDAALCCNCHSAQNRPRSQHQNLRVRPTRKQCMHARRPKS